MSNKPTPIDLVPYADLPGDSREFLRVWAKEDGPVTCFINPVPIGADPFVFGMAKTYAQATGVSEMEARPHLARHRCRAHEPDKCTDTISRRRQKRIDTLTAHLTRLSRLTKF